MATIRQVAREAGVSIATVSRVLSGDPGFHVKDETRSKIMAAVRKLDYEIPLRESYALRFGCVLADTADKYADPFFMEILQAMEETCQERGAVIVSARTYEELADPQILQQFLGEDLSGVFLMEHVSSSVITAIQTHVRHIVFIDDDEPEYRFNNVGFDHTTANWQVMHHLLDKGYRRIGIISGGTMCVPFADTLRLVAYREVLRRAGIAFEEELVKDCQWDLDLCRKQTEELMSLPKPPDAIFAGSDSLASVVLGTLFSIGLRCPEDVGVIGFNNIDLSAHMVPPLTTVAVPTSEIARAAVDRMFQIVKDGDRSIRRILFPTEIIERKSLREK